MEFLVIGGTGTVGSAVVRELLGRRQRVRVLTRDPERARPLGEQIEVHQGDLLDPSTLAGMCDGVDGIFLLNAVSQTETIEGLHAMGVARQSGAKRLVYLSVQRVDRAPHLPHFGSKIAVETAVRASGLGWTILRPSSYFQNDYRYRAALLRHGIYPQPLGGAGVSRVDVRDIAEMAAIALVQGGHEGRTYDVIGPRPLTGEQSAEIWSRALGRPVTYAGDDLDAWERQLRQHLPGWLAHDLRWMYAHIQEHGWRATDEEVATASRVLGHAPRACEDFVAETAAAWSKEGVSAG